ncbi:MAG: P-II family nitrogen regulator [Candidatus Brocadiales bacterium]
MKLLEAIIPPSRLETIKNALNEIGVVRLTVSDVEGFGEGKGREEPLQGKDYTVETLRKVKIEIAVNEAFVKPTIDCILKAGKQAEGRGGIGKIFVLPLEDVIRIRTGERGPDAI